MPKARGKTLSEIRWPDAPEFVAAAERFRTGAAEVLLRAVWAGYDLFIAEVIDQIDLAQADEPLEREITQLLEPRIKRSLSGLEPFDVIHGPYENETKKLGGGQPPQYDIAFFLRANERIMWPLEAKVLRLAVQVDEYVKGVKDNYLTCRYGPFTCEAAMLAYHLAGDPEETFGEISNQLGLLGKHPVFHDRLHRTSEHVRVVPKGKSYARRLKCHHLMMLLRRVPA